MTLMSERLSLGRKKANGGGEEKVERKRKMSIFCADCYVKLGDSDPLSFDASILKN